MKSLVSDLQKPELTRLEKADLLEGFTGAALSQGVHGLDSDARGAAVIRVAKELVEAGRPSEASQFVASAFKNGDISLNNEDEYSVVNATLQTIDFDQIGEVVQEYFNAGALDLQVVMCRSRDLI